MSRLAALLARLVPQGPALDTLDRLRADERTLDLAVSVTLADRPDDELMLLVVDQFEEVFTLCADETERVALLANLCYAATIPGGRVLVVVAMRADFYHRCAAYPELAALMGARQFLVSPLSVEGLRQAIEQPAWRAGLELQTGLVPTILADVAGRPGTLPFLEYVLLEVWRHRQGHLLTLEAYVASGGVEGALAQRASAIYESLTPAQQAVARRALLRLIQPGEGTEDTRRRAERTELLTRAEEEPDLEAVIQALADARLLATGRDKFTGGRMVEVAHEALIRGWPQLRSWIDEDRELLRAHRRLTEDAGEWHQNGRKPEFLYRGTRLAAWHDRSLDDLNDLECEFLAASRRAQAELRRTERSARRIRHLAIATSIVSVIAVLAFIGMFYTYRSGGSRLLGAQAMLQLETDPARALGTAIQALDRWSTPLAQEALTSSLARSHLRTILSGHTGSVNMVEFSPDGRLVVTVGDEGLARTWNTITGQPLAVFGSDIFTARFSPDGSRVVVTASGDNTARVWDAQTGREQAVLRGHQGGVISAQWSPDGSRIVTASSDATARVWDARTGREQTMLSGHEGAVLSVEWNPDEVGIVTGSSDGTARVWNADTGEQLTPFQPSAKPERITTARFSPDGTHIIVATEPALTTQAAASYLWQWANGTPVPLPGGNPKFSPDGRYLLTVDAQTVRIWDARTGERVIELEGHEGRVTVARFNTDGTRIVSGSQDRTARIWDVATGTMLGELRGHDSDVTDVALSPHQPDPFRLMVVTASADSTARVWQPSIGRVLSGSADWMNRTRFNADGTLVVGAGQDGVVRIWRADTGQQPAGLPASSQPLGDAAFSQDGRYVVAGGDDGTVRIWQWRTGTPPVAQLQVGGQVSAVGFDPSGRFVVIAGVDNDARIWQWATGTPPQLLRGHESPVIDATFSPDGALIVTASLDQTARIWDTATAAQLHILEGHTREVRRAAFSPNGRVVVTASEDQTARTWDVATGRQRLSLADHQGELQDAEFSPDGRYLVTGDVDGMVGVWNATTGNKLGLLPLHTNTVTSVGFSPTSHLILTASTDRTPRIYDCEICAPLHDLRQLAEDRQRYAQM